MNSESKETLFDSASYIQRSLAPGFWNIQLFDNQTSDAGAYVSRKTSGKEVTWVGEGNLKRTYVIWRDDNCRYQVHASINSSVMEYFTNSVDSLLIYRIKALVKDAVVYKGKDLAGNANYVATKLKEGGEGLWEVTISVGKGDMEGSFCTDMEYKWGYLGKF